MVEQPSLARKAAAIASERAVRADDAMTRHNNGDGIRPVGSPYRAGSSDVAKARGELPIGDRSSGRNSP